MQFSAKILENNRFLPQTQGVGVSAWEILDPLPRINTSDISASCLRCKFLFYDWLFPSTSIYLFSVACY